MTMVWVVMAIMTCPIVEADPCEEVVLGVTVMTCHPPSKVITMVVCPLKEGRQN